MERGSPEEKSSHLLPERKRSSRALLAKPTYPVGPFFLFPRPNIGAWSNAELGAMLVFFSFPGVGKLSALRGGFDIIR